MLVVLKINSIFLRTTFCSSLRASSGQRELLLRRQEDEAERGGRRGGHVLRQDVGSRLYHKRGLNLVTLHS